MGQLLGPLQYEVNPFANPPRFPIKAAFRAARLCRRAMNIITAFAITSESEGGRGRETLPCAGVCRGLAGTVCLCGCLTNNISSTGRVIYHLRFDVDGCSGPLYKV